MSNRRETKMNTPLTDLESERLFETILREKALFTIAASEVEVVAGSDEMATKVGLLSINGIRLLMISAWLGGAEFMRGQRRERPSDGVKHVNE
jgi:hypothetical protein